MVRILVALHDGDLQNVVLRVDGAGIARVRRDDLAGDQPDDAARTGVVEVLRRQVGNMERVVRALDEVILDARGLEVMHRAVAARQHALAEHHLHIKIVEIVDDGKIGQIARCNGAAVVQGEVAGGVVTGRLHGDDGIDAVVDGLADEIVDVALFQQVARVLVVRAEHAAVVIRLSEQIDECLEVVGSRAVADHDELAVAQLRHGIVHIGALVVGIDARRDIGSQSLAGQAGRMAVDLLVVRLRRNDLGDDFLVAADDTDIVHHLGKALHAGVVIE